MLPLKWIIAHMKAAYIYAENSNAKRLHVGALLVKNNRVLSIGINGMPSGWTNECETKDNVTKPEVLHAEANCLMKIAASTESSFGATMFVTHAPCIHCAKLIYQAGVARLYYGEEYRDAEGLNFLFMSNIPCNRVELNTRELDICPHENTTKKEDIIPNS